MLNQSIIMIALQELLKPREFKVPAKAELKGQA
jgi:hypothetical protein